MEDSERQPLNGNKLVPSWAGGKSKTLRTESNDKENLTLKRTKTAVLGLGLFAVGSSYSAISSVLPDLKDFYETTTANLSFIFTATAAGRVSMGIILGAGLVSLHNPFKWFSFALVLLSAMLGIVPFVGHWQILLFVNFVLGHANGMLYAGSMAYCLKLWRESNSEPCIHYLHFMECCGFLFGPSLATCVLPNHYGSKGLQQTQDIHAIKAYFLTIASIYLIVTPLYLYFALTHRGQSQSDERNVVTVNKDKRNNLFWILVSIFGIMFVLGSIPWSLGMLLTTFAASPHIGIILTRVQGARLYWIFCACMTFARLIAMLVSTQIKASKTVYLSLFGILLSSTAIACRQSSMNLYELATYLALMGSGMGPLYSQTMMTLEEIAPIDKQAAGILYVYHTSGFLVASWGLGQVADKNPYLLFMLCTIAVGLLIICFAILATSRKIICELLEKN